MHREWLVPQWPAAANVHAVCTTRAGGSSLSPFDSLNLGQHVGDSPQAVAANRAVLQKAIDARPVFLSQVHGVEVVSLSADTAHGASADASVTGHTGIVCTVMVADCLPVLLCDQRGSVVAAAHAGWRGLAGRGGHGILESTASELGVRCDASGRYQVHGLMAWLGPCIGPQVFEVGSDVRDAFVLHNPDAATMFRPHANAKWLANLPGLARLRLNALGITEIYGNDGGPAWCTVSNPSRFFSHRRDRVSGRMAACIWMS